MIKHISNQLNKAVPLSNKNRQDISPSVVASFLETIIDDVDDFEKKRVCVFGSASGILPVGIGMLNPQHIVIFQDEKPEKGHISNLRAFKTKYDLIVAKKMPFGCSFFDISIVGPTFEKVKIKNYENIKASLSISKVVYALYPNALKDKLLANISNIEVYGSIPIAMVGSSNYSKNENKQIMFNILKIRKND